MRRNALFLTVAAAVTGLGAAAFAQIEGGGTGMAPIASSGDFEVSGVTVDVAARTSEAARLGGWRLAQRKAWAQLSKRLGAGGEAIGDGTLDQMVSGIVVENEQIGPQRYIARLGVLFNRGRAGALLGISTFDNRSSPMLVIPVQLSGGVGQVFEQRTEWQAAWARFRTGNSAIDYVRPSGNGPDALLLDVGQTGRPGRVWWRTVIDLYGASDILIPTVKLYRQWPGGPVIGVFQARHGPDNRLLGTATLRVGTAAGLPRLLDTGVARLDALYQQALRTGYLNRDPTLSPPPMPQAELAPVEATDNLDAIMGDLGAATTPGTGAGIAITLQFDTPNATAVANTESAIRSIVGVRSAATTSLALGGISLMRVAYDGDPALLRTSLEARGYQVTGQGLALRIRRIAQLPVPSVPQDDSTTG